MAEIAVHGAGCFAPQYEPVQRCVPMEMLQEASCCLQLSADQQKYRQRIDQRGQAQGFAQAASQQYQQDRPQQIERDGERMSSVRDQSQPTLQEH